MGGGNGVVLTDAQRICLSCPSFVVFWAVSFNDMRVVLIASLLLYLKLRLELENT